MINVVIFNGGRGASTLIPSLTGHEDIKLTSIVNAYDDGKSTGEIRSFFEMLGPSDIRKVQELMLPRNNADYKSIKSIFDMRFSADKSSDEIYGLMLKEAQSTNETFFQNAFLDKSIVEKLRFYLEIFIENYELIIKANSNKKINFQDCSLMNCLYAGAFIHFDRNIEHAALHFEKLFSLKGSVLPTSIENKKLVGMRSDGTVLFSEADIVELRSNVSIDMIYLLDSYPQANGLNACSIEEKKLFLRNHHCYVEASKRSQRAITDADIIIYSAGTQHSSLFPTYLSQGISRNIIENKDALKVFISNIGADYETPFYKAHDYLNAALRYLNFAEKTSYDHSQFFDIALINYSESFNEKNHVRVDKSELDKINCLISLNNYEKSNSGKHNGELILEEIMDIYLRKLRQ